MNIGWLVLIIFLTGIVIGAALGYGQGKVVAKEIYNADAIQEGHAEYNQTTGAFQWKEPCE